MKPADRICGGKHTGCLISRSHTWWGACLDVVVRKRSDDHAANVHAPTRGSTPRNSLRCVRVHSSGVNALSPSAICSSRDQCMPGCGRQIPRAPRRQKTTDVSHRCSCAECLRWVSSEATRKRPRPPISLWLATAGA